MCPIEPRLSEQWFLKYPRVEEAKKAVKDGHIKFYPQRWEKTYLHWLDQYTGLVYQPPALVGAPHSSLV